LYNYDKVLSKLDKYKGTVVATLAGHAHRGGYFLDQETGIHHRVCEAVLETPPGDQCHAVVSIFDDRIEIQGRGAFDTDTWMLGDGN
jgi:manganese-dependent ADP-ribose/CDP-alcohol diphosphatase